MPIGGTLGIKKALHGKETRKETMQGQEKTQD